jgi:hypothetical protein
VPGRAGAASPGERFATGFLIAANLVPLAGVLGFGWDVASVVLLYWAENLIAGFYNVLRMATCAAPFAARLFMIPFFIFHYGMFCTVHGAIIVDIFHLEQTLHVSGADAPRLFAAVLHMPGMVWPLTALFASHGISLMENHIVRGEWKTADVRLLMLRPYARMITLHVAIIFGGVLVMVIGSSAAMLVVLVALKLGLDVLAHRRVVGDTLRSPNVSGESS